LSGFGHQGHKDRQEAPVLRAARAAMRLAFPVLAYAVAMAAAWELRNIPADWFDAWAELPGIGRPSLWMTQGHVLLPVAFLLSSLVNRRYGPDYAVAHILIGWALLALFAVACLYRVDPRLPVLDLPPLLDAAAFVGAIVVAHMVAILVFDRIRGVVWWHAPLYSALWGGIVFVLIYYALVHPGGEALWMNRMALDAGVKAAMAFVMLAPYYLMRPIVRPMPGYGGF
jgi:uncharacterized PurR-regulated membrane protein YhhQ (DUF165 family)